jgi:hypothetical protein
MDKQEMVKLLNQDLAGELGVSVPRNFQLPTIIAVGAIPSRG